MLRTHAGIVEACRNGMRQLHLAVVILQEQGTSAVQNAGRPRRECGGVTPGVEPRSRRFHADGMEYYFPA